MASPLRGNPKRACFGFAGFVLANPGRSDMPGSLQVVVYDRQQEMCHDVFTEALEIGRQRDSGEVLYSSRRAGQRARLVIARLDEDTISRDHALVESLG